MADVGELWVVSMAEWGRVYRRHDVSTGACGKKEDGDRSNEGGTLDGQRTTLHTRARTHLSSAERHGMLGVCGCPRLLIGLCFMGLICTSCVKGKGSLTQICEWH